MHYDTHFAGKNLFSYPFHLCNNSSAHPSYLFFCFPLIALSGFIIILSPASHPPAPFSLSNRSSSPHQLSRPWPACFLPLPHSVSAAVLLSLWAVLMLCCMSMAIDFVASLLCSAGITTPDPQYTQHRHVLVIELEGHE